MFDVDGTLSFNGIIPKSAKEALKYLRAKGDLVLLCTGRCLAQLGDVLPEIDVDGYIINNGGCGYLFGKKFYECVIPEDILLSIEKEDCDVAYLSDKDFVVLKYKNYDVVSGFCDYFNIVKPDVKSLDYVNNMSVYSLGLFSYESLDYLKDKYQDLKIVKANNCGYDAFYKGVSKAAPIPILRSMYPDRKIIGFGDNLNDIEMLSSVDVAVVMATAPDCVKKLASFVTRDVMGDGISYAVKELKL